MATPPCPYFGKCGGCSAQHIDYETQLANKRQALGRIVGQDDVQVFSGGEYGYRNRMDFIFHQGGLGLREENNARNVVDIDKCLIANERVNALLAEVRAFFAGADAYNLQRGGGTFRYALIRAPGSDSGISFVLNEDSQQLGAGVERVKAYAKETSCRNVVVAYTPARSDLSVSENFFVAKGGEVLRGSFSGKDFEFPLQGFFQNNDVVAGMMQEYCSTLLSRYPTQGTAFIDLYGGVGTFGIVNAALFRDVRIIDSYAPAIECAKRNIAANKAPNASTIALDAMRISRIPVKRPFYLLIDPPRSGMHQKTILWIKLNKPEAVIYISCNPSQLGKDIAKLGRFRVKSAALFDMFPQTPHSEAVVELVLNESEE